jgi:uncharacterized membrane protein YfhO
MYLTQYLKDFEFETKHDAKPLKVTVRKTGSVDSSDPKAFQLFNLIFREAMAGLKLQNVRRDLYDPKAKVSRESRGVFQRFSPNFPQTD